MADEKATLAFLFPQAVGIADHLHMIFGSLEDAVTNCPEWCALQEDIRLVSTFMLHAGLRNRFCKTCVPINERDLVLRYLGKHADWKWEHMAAFLTRLHPILPILISRFDASKILGHGFVAEGTGVQEIDTAIIKKLDSVLRKPGLALQCSVMRLICHRVDREATWCEGCFCHQAVLQQPELPRRKRTLQYEKESAGCCWKGARGVELALGRSSTMQANIVAANDQWLQSDYARHTPEIRAKAKDFEVKAKHAVVQLISSRLSFWAHLPYLLLGIFGAELGVCDLARAKACAAECIREYEQALGGGLKAKLHRVSHRLLGRGGSFRAMLQHFATSEVGLASYPALFIEIRGLALIPVVCRRIESAHAEYSGLSKKLTIARFAWKAAAMRRKDVAAHLDSSNRFLQFLTNQWRTRLLYQKCLICCYPPERKVEILRLSRNQVLGRWYQSDVTMQFQDRSTQEAGLVAFDALVKPNLKANVQDRSAASTFVGRFLKWKFSEERGTVWAMPKALLAGPDPGFAGNILQVCEAVVAAYHEAPADIPTTDDLFFFEVCDHSPENKKFVRPAHMTKSLLEVSIVEYIPSGTDAGGNPVFVTAGSNLRGKMLDLTPLCSAAGLRSVWCWGKPDTSVQTVAVHPTALAELVGMESVGFARLGAVEASDEQLGTFTSIGEEARSLLQDLFDQEAWVHLDKYIAFECLGCSLVIVQVLEQHAAVRTRHDEFGSLEVALNIDQVTFAERFIARSAATAVLSLDVLMDPLPAHKLDLVLQMERLGWVGSYDREVVDFRDGVKQYSIAMVGRSKLYFVALLLAADLEDRGIHEVMGNMPENYYKCLLHLKDVDALVASFRQHKKVTRKVSCSSSEPEIVHVDTSSNLAKNIILKGPLFSQDYVLLTCRFVVPSLVCRAQRS